MNKEARAEKGVATQLTFSDNNTFDDSFFFYQRTAPAAEEECIVVKSISVLLQSTPLFWSAYKIGTISMSFTVGRD